MDELSTDDHSTDLLPHLQACCHPRLSATMYVTQTIVFVTRMTSPARGREPVHRRREASVPVRELLLCLLRQLRIKRLLRILYPSDTDLPVRLQHHQIDIPDAKDALRPQLVVQLGPTDPLPVHLFIEVASPVH